MITAWRIAKQTYQFTGSSGEGARIYGGRWNPIGIPVIYTAESLSLATLEIIVHLEREQLLYKRFVKIPVTFESSLVFPLSRKKLPKDWASLPPSESTQKIGQKWIERTKHIILKIPSTVIKEEHNYLINPAHPDFSAIEIGKPQRFEFDERLIEKYTRLH
jgi:RES domain-containing protein